MRFDVITLFPQLFEPFLSNGVTRRAFQEGLVEVHLWNPRTFAEGSYRRVDDRPFGGGPGMVLMAEPLLRTLEAIRAARGEGEPVPVILFSPAGVLMRQRLVAEWAAGSGAVLLCGRYEGIDQRFIDAYVDLQVSLGDFVLSGGEIPAMAMLDAIARLQPGVLGDAESHLLDSFNPALDGLLDCPHYTRPEVWRGVPVPAPLMSGNHAQIEQWRRQQRYELTARLRPDLIVQLESTSGGSVVDDGQMGGTEDGAPADSPAGARRYNQRL